MSILALFASIGIFVYGYNNWYSEECKSYTVEESTKLKVLHKVHQQYTTRTGALNHHHENFRMAFYCFKTKQNISLKISYTDWATTDIDDIVYYKLSPQDIYEAAGGGGFHIGMDEYLGVSPWLLTLWGLSLVIGAIGIIGSIIYAAGSFFGDFDD